MPINGDYEPSATKDVRDQVALYERTGGADGNVEPGTDYPVVIVTTRGVRSGKVRKCPLMRVECGGEYALVATDSGASRHPSWYFNISASPTEVVIQDGPEPFDVVAREVYGDERTVWWERAVAAFPLFAELATLTDRTIPIFVVSRTV